MERQNISNAKLSLNKENVCFEGSLGDLLSASVKRESRIERERREFLVTLEKEKYSNTKTLRKEDQKIRASGSYKINFDLYCSKVKLFI